jgi:hypothetical protein
MLSGAAECSYSTGASGSRRPPSLLPLASRALLFKRRPIDTRWVTDQRPLVAPGELSPIPTPSGRHEMTRRNNEGPVARMTKRLRRFWAIRSDGTREARSSGVSLRVPTSPFCRTQPRQDSALFGSLAQSEIDTGDQSLDAASQSPVRRRFALETK